MPMEGITWILSGINVGIQLTFLNYENYQSTFYEPTFNLSHGETEEINLNPNPGDSYNFTFVNN